MAPQVTYAQAVYEMAPQDTYVPYAAPLQYADAASQVAYETMAAPQYTYAQQPAAGSYYLPQSSSMVAYPGMQSTYVVAAPATTTTTATTAPAEEAAPAVVEVKPRKKVTKKVKKGCC